jgi:hypothetical protein
VLVEQHPEKERERISAEEFVGFGIARERESAFHECEPRVRSEVVETVVGCPLCVI